MSVILWTVLAIGLVFVMVQVTASRARSIAPPLVLPPGESLPTAPLQRVARWSVALGLLSMAAAGGLVAWAGPSVYDQDDAVRLTVTALLLASLIVLAAPSLLAGVWLSREDDKVDERDRAILARSPAGQAGSMLITLAIWVIALQETYRGEPGIPGVYLNLIFWSCLLVSQLASNAAILIGYRRT